MRMVYTIGVKRRFWFGYRDYLVNSHRVEVKIGDVKVEPRLILDCADGSTVVIGQCDRHGYIVHADYKLERARLSKELNEAKEKADYARWRSENGDKSNVVSIASSEGK